MDKRIFSMPKSVKITGRTSAVTSSFVSGIIPVLEPTEAEIEDALLSLGMDPEHISCAYCGNPHTDWDHLRPLVLDKRPTGYISEIHNLVPACGKCNQSKGNTPWRAWMLGDADRSPKTRNIPDLEERVRRLEAYEAKYQPIRLDFEAIVGTEKWEEHWENCRRIHAMMQESRRLADEIRRTVAAHVNTEFSPTGGHPHVPHS